MTKLTPRKRQINESLKLARATYQMMKTQAAKEQDEVKMMQ